MAVGLRGLLLLVVCSVAAASPTAAAARGGRTIAEAPQIALGQQQLNSLNGIDFYRVALRSGDQLTLRYGPQQQFDWAEICLFQPGISDATVSAELERFGVRATFPEAPMYAASTATVRVRVV